MNSKYFLATICLFISSFHTVRADDRWIAFRNDGTNHSNAADLPVKWSPSNGIAWQKELPGYGQSSPLLWDGCLYLTEVRGPMKNQSVIIAIDSSSGELKWECPVETTEKDANYDQRCRAASTPVVDEAGVYAFFSGGDLFSVSHQGKLRWKRQLTKEYGKFQNGHGLGSSLAQTSDSVIVLIDHEGPSYLLAVDKQTGKNKWKVDRKQRTSWTSPVVANQTVASKLL
ncbi:MAG: PQQ-binding-like beta-propeller repeat protein [Planctomycetota bacterium]